MKVRVRVRHRDDIIGAGHTLGIGSVVAVVQNSARSAGSRRARNAHPWAKPADDPSPASKLELGQVTSLPNKSLHTAGCPLPHRPGCDCHCPAVHAELGPHSLGDYLILSIDVRLSLPAALSWAVGKSSRYAGIASNSSMVTKR